MEKTERAKRIVRPHGKGGFLGETKKGASSMQLAGGGMKDFGRGSRKKGIGSKEKSSGKEKGQDRNDRFTDPRGGRRNRGRPGVNSIERAEGPVRDINTQLSAKGLQRREKLKGG